MQLTLTAEEARELRQLLTDAIAELRSEIHHTDAPEFRQRLHARERLLHRLSERFDADAA
jgi:hypothetical protein